MRLSEEALMLKDIAKRFAKEELMPLENELDAKNDLPPETWKRLIKKAIDVGLWMCMIPKEYGGGGVNWVNAIGIWEEIAAVSCVFERMLLSNPGVEIMGYNLATKDQMDRFFLPLMRGEKLMFHALTEPDAGSDTSMIKTKAVKKGDQWIINGSKRFISIAPRADFGLVFAITDPSKPAREGTSVFFVEKGTPGFKIDRTPEYMGSHGMLSSDLVFEDCAVPEANLLGTVNGAYREVMRMMGGARILTSACSLGIAKRSLKIATDYSLTRITWGKPIAARQYIQGMLVDSATEIYASECMLYDAAWEADNGNEDPKLQAMVKLFITEMTCQVCDRAIQVCGGVGYTKDMPLEKLYRDSRVLRMGDGTSEIQKLIIASRLIGRQYAFDY
jgi:acyl-CoA dehydrogenase